MRGLLVLAGVAAASALSAAPAHAASYDCAKAVSADEVTICATPRLSMLDSEMGALWYSYSRIPMMMGGQGARMDDARQFLKDRAACARNVRCLTQLYVARNAALRRQIDIALRNVTIR